VTIFSYRIIEDSMHKKKLSDKKNRGNSAGLKTLSKEVSEKLVKRIINGTYPAGSKLPTGLMSGHTWPLCISLYLR
jgi:hypothetical protein